jgi:ferritin
MTEKLQNALNEQITAELWSANLYLSMSFYLEREGFSGMARWMQKQSAEEIGHVICMIMIMNGMSRKRQDGNERIEYSTKDSNKRRGGSRWRQLSRF